MVLRWTLDPVSPLFPAYESFVVGPRPRPTNLPHPVHRRRKNERTRVTERQRTTEVRKWSDRGGVRSSVGLGEVNVPVGESHRGPTRDRLATQGPAPTQGPLLPHSRHILQGFRPSLLFRDPPVRVPRPHGVPSSRTCPLGDPQTRPKQIRPGREFRERSTGRSPTSLRRKLKYGSISKSPETPQGRRVQETGGRETRDASLWSVSGPPK